jgi:hypothetical protein
MRRTHITLIEETIDCHEVVVQHGDGSLECAGGECTVDLKVHRFVVDCADVDCPDCDGVRLVA